MEDLSTEPVAERASSAFNPFNLLAVIFLILSCLSALCVGAVFASPGLVPALLRAPTEVALITLRPRSPDFTPTLTSIISTLPPEWTATHTPTVTGTPTQSQTPSNTPTGTLRPTSTSTATITPTPSRTPTATPTGPTPTPSRTRSAFQFTMQNDQPSYIQNFANTAGCNWMGIAGQAFDLRSSPMQGLIVHIEGGGLNYDVITGDPRFSAYGPGGYELYVGNKVTDTTDVYRVQLRNQTGQPFSDVFVIRTFADCRRNLILVNFVQNH